VFIEADPSQPRKLRQGDVCVMPYVPEWRLDKVGRTFGDGDQLSSVTLPLSKTISPEQGGYLVSVCSQCCDIEHPNGRMGVAVAPIRNIPLPHDRTEERSAIMASYRAIDSAWAWVHLFPLHLPDNRAVVVDWASITTLMSHRAAVNILLSGKQHELTEEYRQHYRTKLAACFGRPPVSSATA